MAETLKGIHRLLVLACLGLAIFALSASSNEKLEFVKRRLADLMSIDWDSWHRACQNETNELQSVDTLLERIEASVHAKGYTGVGPEAMLDDQRWANIERQFFRDSTLSNVVNRFVTYGRYYQCGARFLPDSSLDSALAAVRSAMKLAPPARSKPFRQTQADSFRLMLWPDSANLLVWWTTRKTDHDSAVVFMRTLPMIEDYHRQPVWLTFRSYLLSTYGEDSPLHDAVWNARVAPPGGNTLIDAAGDVWFEISGKRLDEAYQHLSSRLNASNQEVEVAGIGVSRSAILLVGPAAILALLAYYLAHLQFFEQHVRTLQRHEEEAHWLPIFADRLGMNLMWLSTVFLPIGAVTFLVFRLSRTAPKFEIVIAICIAAAIPWFAREAWRTTRAINRNASSSSYVPDDQGSEV